MKCNQCDSITINGHYCHETSCPNSHLDHNGEPYTLECLWCGSDFTPEERGQRFCDLTCAESYYC